MKSADIAFHSYLRYELFHILDHLSLMIIFHHFTFCTRTCHLNCICRLCGRVVYKNPRFTEKCSHMFKDYKLRDICNRGITAMFQNSKQWFSWFIFQNFQRSKRCLFSFHGNNCPNLFEFTKYLLKSIPINIAYSFSMANVLAMISLNA